MNSHQRKIYASQLQHAERRNHKYLYKIGDRYVYPEDVKNNAKSKVQGFVADQKQKLKDKKFVKEREKLKKKDVADEYGSYDEWLKSVNKHNAATDKGKQVNQISSAHTRSTVGIGPHLLSYQKGEHGTTANLEKQKAKTAARKRPYDEKARDAGFQAEMERRQATINARNAKDRKSSDFANLTKAERDTAERKKSREASTKNTEQQRKSAHAGYEADKKAFPEGGSTEELERQKKKTKARKSASKRFNELDQKNKRSSNSMEPDIHKQHSQINSAHQMATERRLAGNKHSDREWNRQNLYSVNYYDQSGSIERQKRKTSLRKRHKK